MGSDASVSTALAQSDGENVGDWSHERCEATSESDSCAPFFACVQAVSGESISVIGRAYGWNAGVLEARTTTGAVCTGSWAITQAGGEIRGSCDDDRRFSVLSTYQHLETGTAVSTGETNAGEPIVAWSGLHVPDYLSALDEPPRWIAECVGDLVS